jgi:hypothetical protein
VPLKSFFVFVCAILFSALAAVPAPVAAALPDNACAMVSQDQMSKIFGVQVAAGENPANFTRTCTWNVAAGPAPRLKSITLFLQSADQFETAKQMQQASKFDVESVSGVGDDAYYSSVGNVTSLIVKKGNVAFKIGMYGEFPLDKKKAMSKAMAVQVLSKL